MYQYSLEWFIGIFLNSIANADASGTPRELLFIACPVRRFEWKVNQRFSATLAKYPFWREHFVKHEQLFIWGVEGGSMGKDGIVIRALASFKYWRRRQGWVSCWFSPLLREIFSPVFPSPQKQTFQIPILSDVNVATDDSVSCWLHVCPTQLMNL